MTLLPTHPAPEGRFSVIVFFRGLHCSNCRKQLAEIDGRLGELKDVGVGKVVAVSMETGDRSTLVVDQWHLADLPVAFGLDEESARSWGLNLSRAIKDGEPELFNEPGIFILDADGTLFWSTITTMPFGRPSLDDIIAGVRYARDHNYPARGSA
jgi:peroxiredoxin